MVTSEQTTLPCYLHRTPCRMGEGSTSGNPWGNSRKKGDLEKAGETNQLLVKSRLALTDKKYEGHFDTHPQVLFSGFRGV